ncbi:MAG: CAP domain-containing protein [Gammaproteobacteria bacterium]|nr:CAP domain-containing protein [Gammaproteobacteria bacterium]
MTDTSAPFIKPIFCLILAIAIGGCGGGGSGKTASNQTNSEVGTDSSGDTIGSTEQSKPDATDQSTTDANTDIENNTSPTTPLERINHFRAQAGLPSLSFQYALAAAAENHANYLLSYPTHGHDENEGNAGFTGQTASERTIFEGFFSRIVSENISQGNENYAESIDGLMSAIYHRFGFLDSTIDLIGFANAETSETTAFVYNMANAAQNQLCQSESTFESGRYYVDICKDTFVKIAVDDWESTKLALQQNSDDIIIWPPIDGSDIVPVFYEESPDPLPDYSVSGQPISLEFNPEAVGDHSVVVTGFSLKKGNTEVAPIRAMDQSTDPNQKFSTLQFAWFPLERLDWNSTYAVRVDYEINGAANSLSWQFSTRELPSAPIDINASTELSMVSGDTIYLSFEPINGQSDGGILSEYDSRQTLDIEQIDLETTKLTLSGPSGSQAKITKGQYVISVTLE